MRNSVHQAGRRPGVRADEVADASANSHGPIDARPGSDDRWADDTEPETSERITLIEFTWFGLTGAQAVILVAREWLQ